MKHPIGPSLGLLLASELQLADALLLVAARHARDAATRDGGPKLAEWSREHRSALEPFTQRYGQTPSEGPARVRAALLSGNRMGAIGLLRDLEDLSILAHQVSLHWTTIEQAAKELRDSDLVALAERATSENREQLAWLETRIKQTAPQTLTVPPNFVAEARASLPRRPSAAAIPDPVWGPSAGAILIAVVGILGLLVGRPWLLPSLGPTAYLQAAMPAHPSSRAWNTIVGHLVGLAAGFVAVALLNAWQAPAPLIDQQLVAIRVLAAAIAIGLTIVMAEGLRASHPPAAATALLVALGSIATLTDAVNLMLGAVVLALIGHGFRYIRLHAPVPNPA
jgi:hypothetical protein